MWDILGIAAIVILLVVCVSLQLDLAPTNPKWRRRWAWFAYGTMGIFLVWLVVLIGFIQ
jgi:bacteriorhodopsin